MSSSALLEFNGLVRSIVHVHQELGAQAARAVNLSLTLRNWMIGYYIDAYELRGADRAGYGDQLFANLARELTAARLSNCDKRQLYRYLRLFRTYPQIVGTLSPQLKTLLPWENPSNALFSKVESLPPLFRNTPLAKTLQSESCLALIPIGYWPLRHSMQSRNRNHPQRACHAAPRSPS